MSVEDEHKLLARLILSNNLAAVHSDQAVLQLNCRNLLFLNIQNPPLITKKSHPDAVLVYSVYKSTSGKEPYSLNLFVQGSSP